MDMQSDTCAQHIETCFHCYADFDCKDRMGLFKWFCSPYCLQECYGDNFSGSVGNDSNGSIKNSSGSSSSSSSSSSCSSSSIIRSSNKYIARCFQNPYKGVYSTNTKIMMNLANTVSKICNDIRLRTKLGLRIDSEEFGFSFLNYPETFESSNERIYIMCNVCKTVLSSLVISKSGDRNPFQNLSSHLMESKYHNRKLINNDDDILHLEIANKLLEREMDADELLISSNNDYSYCNDDVKSQLEAVTNGQPSETFEYSKSNNILKEFQLCSPSRQEAKTTFQRLRYEFPNCFIRCSPEDIQNSIFFCSYCYKEYYELYNLSYCNAKKHIETDCWKKKKGAIYYKICRQAGISFIRGILFLFQA